MNPGAILSIDGINVSQNSPTYFIADIAANHDGDINRAVDLIYAAAENGANAAKFQHFKPDTIVSNHGFLSLGNQQSHQAGWKKSVYEVYKDASVKYEWSLMLKETCEKAGITFFTTPYSLEAVEELDSFVPAFKVGSGDITWLSFIEEIAKKRKPYIIASGASSLNEVEKAVARCLAINPNLCLMQCNTNYTASLDNFKYINLNVLKTYSLLFPEVLLGLSDHTPGHATVLGAIALGARMIEKHFTDDNSREGPDHQFSMNPVSWKEMVDRSRELEISLGSAKKKVEDNELETVVLQRRALRAKSSLKKGSRLSPGLFVALRPCPQDSLDLEYHLDLGDYNLARDLSEGDYLRRHDIETIRG